MYELARDFYWRWWTRLGIFSVSRHDDNNIVFSHPCASACVSWAATVGRRLSRRPRRAAKSSLPATVAPWAPSPGADLQPSKRPTTSTRPTKTRRTRTSARRRRRSWSGLVTTATWTGPAASLTTKKKERAVNLSFLGSSATAGLVRVHTGRRWREREGVSSCPGQF